MDKFDLIVIGSGPGGQRAAVQGAKLGKKVLVIEKDKIGGACLHYGTIPSKTLREAVINDPSIDAGTLSRVLERMTEVIGAETKIIGDQLSRNHVQTVQGVASFVDARTVRVQASGLEQRFTADIIVLATGTRPRRPSDIPFASGRVFDSDTILGIAEKPKSLCVFGAGVIGVEYASIFARMGVEVTVVDRRTDLLRGIDRELVAALQKRLELSGTKVHLGVALSGIQVTDAHARIEIDGQIQKFSAALYCMGRQGNVEQLNLKEAGLEPNSRGLLDVNAHFQTRVPHIYAVGDLIGSPALAASASEQGRLAVTHGFGVKNSGFPKLFPFGIYTIPEISSVGAEEKDLIEQKIPYVVGRAHYRELARGKIAGDELGMAKLIFHRDNRRLLGVHIIGSQATELVHIGQVAMSHDATVEDMLTLVFNYPTFAEGYKVAALNAYNQMPAL